MRSSTSSISASSRLAVAMADTSAARFGLEAVFLVLLAVAVGFADLDTWLIGFVMGGGWLLVALIEWLAWRASRPLPPPVLQPAQVSVPVGGWDVQEIIAPVVAQEPEPEPEAQTTILEREEPPAEPAEEPTGEPPPEPERRKRRWRRGSGASE